MPFTNNFSQEFRQNCSNYNLWDHIAYTLSQAVRNPRDTRLTPRPLKKLKTRSHSAWSGSRQYLQEGLNHPGFTHISFWVQNSGEECWTPLSPASKQYYSTFAIFVNLQWVPIFFTTAKLLYSSAASVKPTTVHILNSIWCVKISVFEWAWIAAVY